MKFTIKLLIALTLGILVFNISNINVAAKVNSETYIDKEKNTEWQIESETIKQIAGMTQIEVYGKSKSTEGNGCQSFGGQHVNVLEMKTDGINSKLVCWGVQSGSTGVTKSSLTQIAKDYEKKHPGWIVLGGVNGDQYFMNYGTGIYSDGSWLYTPTACYPLTIDNEIRYPISPIGVYSNYRGILNNGENESFAEEATGIGYRVEIIDENNNILYYKDVDNINKAPASGEVTVWSSYISNTSSSQYVEFDVTTDKNLYIVEIPELAYMPSSSAYNAYLSEKFPEVNFPDVIFARGTITKIDKTHHFGGNKNKQEEYNKVNTFAIETDDADLQAKLTLNTRIRVEYYYSSEELNKCESFLNYHSVQRLNNADVYSDQPYDLQRYSRSVWGRKADGTYVLLTTAKSGLKYVGTSQTETNALLEKYGVVEAFQQDGGGSAMCIVRNLEKGTFELAQPSSDGTGTGQRSVAYGCLFVVRDPGLEVNTKETTYHSGTITWKEDYDHSDISNVKVLLDGKTYEMVDSKVVLENLKPGTKYEYTITYDVTTGGKTVSASMPGYLTTDEFPYPLNIVKVKNIEKNKVEFEFNTDNINNLSINIDGTSYKCSGNNISISELTGNTEYEYYYEYDIKNTYTDETYHYMSVKDTVKTLEKALPYLTNVTTVSVSDTKYICKPIYSDEDNLITSIYVLMNNVMYEIDSNGEILIDALTPETKYNAEFVIEYGEESIRRNISFETEAMHSKGCNAGMSFIYISIMVSTIILFIKRKN